MVAAPRFLCVYLVYISCLTAYSDYSDGLEHLPKFWSDTEYLAYLDGSV